MSRWISHKEVRAYLGVSAETLRRLMASTPDDCRVWANVGTTARPRYRWLSDLTAINSWLLEANQWSQSAKTSAGTGGSGGVTSTGDSESGRGRGRSARA